MEASQPPIAVPKKGRAKRVRRSGAAAALNGPAHRGNPASKAGLAKAIVRLPKIPNERRFYGAAGSIAPILLINKLSGALAGGRSQILENIRKGLKFSTVVALAEEYGANLKEIGVILAIPPSTLTRRQKGGVLRVDESDRIIRLANLKDSALAMMQGNNEAAVSWLRTPLDILNGETPMARAGTEMGARDVEDLIGRIRHGVHS